MLNFTDECQQRIIMALFGNYMCILQFVLFIKYVVDYLCLYTQQNISVSGFDKFKIIKCISTPINYWYVANNFVVR